MNAIVSFFVAQALVLLGVLVAYITLRRERKKEIQNQAARHQENLSRLDALAKFQIDQVRFNENRDETMGELRTQTARITAILEGQNRRMEMLENRRWDHNR